MSVTGERAHIGAGQGCAIAETYLQSAFTFKSPCKEYIEGHTRMCICGRFGAAAHQRRRRLTSVVCIFADTAGPCTSGSRPPATVSYQACAVAGQHQGSPPPTHVIKKATNTKLTFQRKCQLLDSWRFYSCSLPDTFGVLQFGLDCITRGKSRPLPGLGGARERRELGRHVKTGPNVV